jgi:hypothetical protein
MRQRRRVLEEPHPTARRGGRCPDTKKIEAALAAAQAYLLATRPEHGDPREGMHQVAMRSLGIVEGKIREQGPEIKSTSHKGNQKEKFRYNHTDNDYSESSEEKKQQKRKKDARSIIAQA